MNPAGLRMLQVEEECAVVGVDYLSVVCEEDLPRIRGLLEAALEGRFSEFEFTTKTGQVLRSNFVPLEVEPGAPARLMGITQNVTERRNLEAQLLRARELEAVGRLAGGVAHDFNNLLTVISGSTSLLRLRYDSTPPELDVLEQATAAACDLTRQLQAFAGLRRSTPQRVSLSGTVQDARSLLRSLVGAGVQLEVETTEPGYVRIDPSDLSRILVNLVTNAADALDCQGKISLAVRAAELSSQPSNPAGLPNGSYLSLSVSDTGCGMGPEVLERLFEPFFTTKAGTHAHGGTGLGLATCHGIAGQAGGGIEVESQPGVGTRVTTFLPVYPAEPELPPAAPSPRILVVEAEPLLRQLITTTLEASRFQVLACSSAEEALEHRSESYDLLMTDLTLPGQSGFELAKALAGERPELPVICTSGLPEGDRLVESGLQGRVAFLAKPHGTAELVELVERLLSPRTR
jgi:two-component system, cell cycle sensor histidine kinase and response regulator CckA